MAKNYSLNSIKQSARIRSQVPTRYITDDRDFIESGLNPRNPAIKQVLTALRTQGLDAAWEKLLEHFARRKSPVDPFALTGRTAPKRARNLRAQALDRLSSWRDKKGKIDWNRNNKPARKDYEKYWMRNNLSFLMQWTAAANSLNCRKTRNAVADIFLEWVSDCPVPEFSHNEYWDRENHGFSWREIEVGNRARNLQAFFFSTRSWTDVAEPFHRTLLILIKQHLDYLSSYTFRHAFIPGNHQTHHAPGMFAAAILLPELKGAGLWKTLSTYIYKDHIQSDHDKDGVQNEYSPGYHYSVLSLYRGAFQLLMANKIPVPTWLSRLLTQMAEYCRYVIAPSGMAININDARPFNALGQMTHIARKLNRPELDPENKKLRPLSRAYKSGGIALMRSGWNADDTLVVLDATGHNSGHWHAGKPNLLIYSGDLPLVCEHQFANYDDPSFYKYFHHAQSHNTVMVDGRGDSKPIAPWEYSHMTDHGLTDFASGTSVDIAGAYTHGFRRLKRPVSFDRTVIFLKPDLVIVHDFMRTTGKHVYDWMLHFFPQKLHTDRNNKTLSTAKEYSPRLTCTPAPDIVESISGPLLKQGKTRNETSGFEFIGRKYWEPPTSGKKPRLLAKAPYAVWRSEAAKNTHLTFLLQVHQKASGSSSVSMEPVDCKIKNVFVYRIQEWLVYIDHRTAKNRKPVMAESLRLPGRAGAINLKTGEKIKI